MQNLVKRMKEQIDEFINNITLVKSQWWCTLTKKIIQESNIKTTKINILKSVNYKIYHIVKDISQHKMFIPYESMLMK